MNEQIRILHVIGQMNRGGAESMIMNIYRKIDRTKIQFDFVVHTDSICDFDDEIKSLGGKIYNCPRFTGTNLVSYIKFWNEFFKEHKEYKIIHGHIGSSASIYLKIAKKNGLFTIAHSHSGGFDIGIKGTMYRVFSYPTRFIADYFFACSENAGISRYGKRVVNNKTIFSVLKNAIDVNQYAFSEEIRDKKRKELNLENKFVIGHVGRFDKAKNQEYLVEIFKLIAKKNENTMLLLIGDGELRPHIIEKVKNCGLEDKVIFTGVRSDVNELLQAMDVFVFPSVYEGLPVTVIEAQAAGLPCLISDTITDEVCITSLVQKLSINESVEEWYKKIVLLYQNGSKHEEIFKNIGIQGYDINTSVSNLEKFYLDI
ncbi:MAG: glycosyltransferase family 1 protein [Intestinibacter bartlettii]|uniref:glycosyltransferase family 1 protein n=1 Tax=Intestinibacter bartlettii TaxID=261299 RepID=UPI00242FE6A1|nr:glycosyltransferase family 1 protein [Intestinibacter bartlettii]MBS7146771.1 glycosyltransferase family 1 protein [Intestinibacter bartlettii]